MGTAPRVGQFLADMHGHSANFLRTELMNNIMPGYLLTEVVELPVKAGHVLIESLVRSPTVDQYWRAMNKHLYVVDVDPNRVVAMWNYDGHTLGIATYRAAVKAAHETDAQANLRLGRELSDRLIDRAYRVLKDIRNQWLGRGTHEGQGLLVDLNQYLANATAKSNREVADFAPWPADEATAYKTAAEPLIDHLTARGYSLAEIDSVIATAPKFWKRACAAFASGSIAVAENLFRANLDG